MRQAGGKFPAGQVTLTMPVKPPVGVTAIVEAKLLPAVTAASLPAMVKEPVVPPPIVPVKVKCRIVLPPKAIGLGSA